MISRFAGRHLEQSLQFLHDVFGRFFPVLAFLLTALFALAMFALVLAVIVYGARFVLAPMLAEVSRSSVERQYSLADTIYLLLLLSFAMFLSRQFDDWSAGAEHFAVTMLMLLFAGAMWWLGLSCLNQRGVVGHRRRGVFIVLVVPIAVVAPLAAMSTFMGVFAWADQARWRLAGAQAAGFVAIVVLAIVARALSRWVAREVEPLWCDIILEPEQTVAR